MRKEREERGGTVPFERLKKLYLREFASVADDVYYSIIFEREYPTLAKIFESAVLDEVESFRRIGAIIDAIGKDPSLNLRLGQSKARPADLSRISSQDIHRIIGYVIQRERSGIALCRDILAASEDLATTCAISETVAKKEELSALLRRVLDS